MRNLEIDIETYSSVSLQKCGVYKYAESPDFEILLFGYSADGGEVRVIDLASGETLPADVLSALTDDSVTKWAFNAQFERVCLSRYLSDLGVSLDPFHDRHPLSTESAAEVAGIKANHTEVKRMLQNVHYLGDDVYPRIIDDDIFNAVQAERQRREKALGRDNIPPKEKPVPVIFTEFRMKKATKKITDPIAQAEYAYSRIEGKVNE